jgi:hypothetical protein
MIGFRFNRRHRAAVTGALATAMLTLGLSGPAAADTHTGKTIRAIHAPSVTVDCVFFTLAGVSVADAAVGSTWFAVDRNNPGFNQIYVLLLEMKHTTRTNYLTVGTTGNAICGGHAEVSYVYAE